MYNDEYEELIEMFIKKIYGKLNQKINRVWINVVRWDDEEIIITASINGVGISKHYTGLANRIMRGTMMDIVPDFIKRYKKFVLKDLFETSRYDEYEEEAE